MQNKRNATANAPAMTQKTMLQSMTVLSSGTVVVVSVMVVVDVVDVLVLPVSFW